MNKFQTKQIVYIFDQMQQQGTVSIGNYSFNQKDILGKGVTGNVFKGKRNGDDYPVAIKVINLKQNQNEITLSLLETQLKALKLIKPHPNLIRTLDIFQNQNFCFIVTELYSEGTLKQLLQKQGSLNSQVSLQIFQKIVSAYCAISDASIIHRDLKPANIMLKQGSFEPVIIDFGFAEIIQTKTVMKAFNVGSPAYMAPEAFTKTLYSEKSDVWSLGVILYEMLIGQTLDEGIETKGYFTILSDNFISQKIVSLGQIFKQILSQVLRMNPFERISIHKIKYILDKHLIMKMNNPVKSLHSSIQFAPSSIIGFKSEPLLMNKSNSFDDENRKQLKSVFQSGHFDMCNSVHNTNGSSNLTIFKGNNLKAKMTESRYRVNMMSPVRHSQTKQTTEVNRSIEKSNQFHFKNCVTQKLTTLDVPKRLQTQPIHNSLQMHYEKQHFYTNNQPFNSKENSKVQTQYLALRPRETNLIQVVPQKQYFNQPNNMLRPNNQFTFNQPNNQYTQQPLAFRQTIAEDRKIIKQKSPNPQKFSFKKMAQYQDNCSKQYFFQQKQQGGKQNSNLRHQTGQSVTQLNFNQSLYSSVHQNSNFMVRNHLNQPLNHNIQPQLSIVRRIF